MKSEILYGIHPVHAALRAGRRKIYEIYLAGDKNRRRVAAIAALAASRNLPFKKLKVSEFNALAGAEGAQAIAARVSPYPLVSVQKMLSAGPPMPVPPLVLLVDQIQDPHNLGALIRTVLGVGAAGVVIPRDRCASPSPSVSRISAGALEYVRLARVTNLVRTVRDLKTRGLWIVGLDQNAEQNIFASDLSGPLAMVIGGEQKGMRPLVKKNCDFLVSIPLRGPVGSLNASVAGAVGMYEAFRQRAAKASDSRDVRV